MKKLLIIILMFCSHIVTAQNILELDTNAVMRTVKLNLIWLNKETTQEQMNDILDIKLEYRQLESKGFKDMVFFEIIGFEDHEFGSRKYLYPSYYETFIIGCNLRSRSIYRLKGFNINDFEDFFRVMDAFIDIKEASFVDMSKHKRFVKKFYIEGLDLSCLYKSLKSKKNKRCLKENYPKFDVW